MNVPRSPSRRTSCRVLVAGLILGAGSPAGKGRAQDVEDARAPAAIATPQVPEAWFETRIFGNEGGSVAAYDRLDRVLAARVGDLERTCGLRPPQRTKLILAGRVDIDRFRARVAEARTSFDLWKWDLANRPAIAAATRPLAATLAGDFFDEGSFFAKTIGLTLDPAQRAHRRVVLAERAARRHEARVALAVADLGATVGFAAGQAERFTAVILAETTPAERPAGPLAMPLVLYQINAIPTSKLMPIFDEFQWRALRRRLVDAQASEGSLRANGLLDPAGSPPGPRPD